MMVLEDNPYGMLRYEGEPLPTLHSLDARAAKRGGASDFVVYLGTFSKILSPGVRLGWAVAPRPVMEKLNLCKQGADLCSSPVTQLFVAAYFAERGAAGEPVWLAQLDSLKALYRERRDAMLAALTEHFGAAASWTQPQGGLFIWATLPDYIDTTDLLARALESEAVAFVPGRAAYLDGRGGSSMRLNFAGVPEPDIREGIRRIGKVVREQVGLFGTLTGAKPAAPSPSEQAPVTDPDLAEVVELPQRESRRRKRG
jgi:2-aminoadipate transaminase